MTVALTSYLNVSHVLVFVGSLSLCTWGCHSTSSNSSTDSSTAATCEGASCSEPLENEETVTVEVVAGEDYFLPSRVKAEAYSGYVDHPQSEVRGDGLYLENWWTNWRALEPERGQYNWDLVDTRIAKAATDGVALNLHFLNTVVDGGDPERNIVIHNTVPDWVFDDFNLNDEDLMNLGYHYDMRVIPAWRQDIREAFNDMVRAFGERGYPQSDQVAAAYIHGISPSLGEEFWLSADNIAELEAGGGFNSQVLYEWIKSRMDAYAEAFTGVEHKLAWVGTDGTWRYWGGGYPSMALQLVDDAWELGAGVRTSIVERYHIYLNESALGQAVDENGYLTVDETIAPIANECYFGDENEEYGPNFTWRYGSQDGEAQRYRLAILRALQMRMRFLWTSEMAEAINPPLSEYARLSFGKLVHNSPDAWCYLKESPVNTATSPPGVVRNFERWLLQRDVPGGMTIPTERVDREFNAGSISDSETWAYYDYVARRTDIANDNPYIYFDLDDRFTIDGPIDIKVELRASNTTSWWIDYVTTTSQVKSTPVQEITADGEVRTYTFTIDDAQMTNDLPHDMDFRIVSGGPEDVAVRWVRLLRDGGE